MTGNTQLNHDASAESSRDSGEEPNRDASVESDCNSGVESDCDAGVEPNRDSGEDGTEPVLSVSELSVSLGGADILTGVDLSVDAGELVGLVGPNGAGKTTLLRTIRGTLTPDSGRVSIQGESTQRLSSKAASRLVATVPQDTSLSFEFSVRETIEMGRTPHLPRFGGMSEADYDVVEQAMERTDVAALADRPVTAISGGERSRVLLARALAQDTPLLLLDEPTASLDLNHQLRTFDTVADLTDSGRTAVAAIHDLNLAARYCDRLVVVAGGGVLADGPPETVLNGGTLRDAFDAEAVVTRDPVTERPHVTALSGEDTFGGPDVDESAGPETGAEPDGGSTLSGLDRVHVVAGGGRAGPLLTSLGRTEIETTVGPVAEGDTDADVADALGMETLRVGALESVDSALAGRISSVTSNADAVVVADVDLTEGVVPVLQAVGEAGVPLFCIEDRNVSQRSVSERATERYRALRATGTHLSEAAFRDALR